MGDDEAIERIPRPRETVRGLEPCSRGGLVDVPAVVVAELARDLAPRAVVVGR
jgi:hypothetical protein